MLVVVATGVGRLTEPSRCPHTHSPFDLTAWVNQISNIAQFSPEDSSFGTLLGRVFEVASVVVVDIFWQQEENTESSGAHNL